MALFVLTVPFSVRFKLTVPFLGSFKEFRFWVCSASGMLSSTPTSLYTGICFVLPRRSPVSTQADFLQVLQACKHRLSVHLSSLCKRSDGWVSAQVSAAHISQPGQDRLTGGFSGLNFLGPPHCINAHEASGLNSLVKTRLKKLRRYGADTRQ
jgi:hypothetical protein